MIPPLDLFNMLLINLLIVLRIDRLVLYICCKTWSLGLSHNSKIELKHMLINLKRMRNAYHYTR